MSLTVREQEIQCAVWWFCHWTVEQHIEFLALLLQKAVPGDVNSLTEELDLLSIKQQDQTPTIFQAQLRLFSSWFDQWTDKERNTFVRKLQEKNRDFADHFHEEVLKRTNLFTH